MKLFYDTRDIQKILDVSIRVAQMRIKAMNDELLEKGYWVEQGKIPINLFHEKYPYIPKDVLEVNRSDQ